MLHPSIRIGGDSPAIVFGTVRSEQKAPRDLSAPRSVVVQARGRATVMQAGTDGPDAQGMARAAAKGAPDV